MTQGQGLRKTLPLIAAVALGLGLTACGAPEASDPAESIPAPTTLASATPTYPPSAATGGPIAYPQVVGHEIVGCVAEIGSAVTKHKVGDTVGSGCPSHSCRTCAQCLECHDQYYLNGNTQTYGSVDPADGTITQGGYSQAVVTNEDYVLAIPAGLDPAKAAPLLCAGITTTRPSAFGTQALESAWASSAWAVSGICA